MNFKAIIQAILYTAGSDGADVSLIKKAVDLQGEEIHNLIKEMKHEYDQDENFGLTIKNYGNVYYLVTKEGQADNLAKLVDIKKRNALSQATLETLAIIAYNHPCTASKIAELRGIDPKNTLDKLINLGLVENNGRSDLPGRPYTYSLTKKFFDLFGIKSLSSLPKLDVSLQSIDEDFFNSNRYEEDEE